MKTLKPQLLAEIRAHAKEAMPCEACGFVLSVKRKRVIRRAKNSAAKPQRDWRIAPDEFMAAEAEGTIVGIYHSHPYGRAQETDADRASCEATRVPYIIAAYPVDEFKIIEPSGYVPPLKGRDFVHGVLDCFALVRDYYRTEHKIEIPDFHRDDLWWEKGQNLYLENFASAGFVDLGPDWRVAQPGDAFLMRFMSETVNHAAIYSGHNKILHHVTRALSREEFLSQYWQDCVAKVVRHKSFLK